MSEQEEINTTLEEGKPHHQQVAAKGFIEYISLFITTCLVGYLPLAPGTWGSIVGVLIYIGYGSQVLAIQNNHISNGGSEVFFSAASYFVTAFLLLTLCLIGILASARVEKLLNNKDPQIIVVDEVMGQLVTFAFVPFGISWKFILAGFVLFRLFDIWKPYPVRDVEILPNGVGVCADDLVAGIYAGVCLSLIYLVSFAL